MVLSVRSDSSRPAGGYAILASDTDALPQEIMIEDRSREEFLNEAGKWTRQPVLLNAERIDGKTLRLSPAIVDAIAADSPIAVHGVGETALGALIWPAIRPSAGVSGGGGALLGRDDVANVVHGEAISPPAPPPPPAAAPPPPSPPPPPRAAVVPPAQEPVAKLTSPAPALTRRKAWAAVLVALVFGLVTFLAWNGSSGEQSLACGRNDTVGKLVQFGLLRACAVAAPQNAQDDKFAAFNVCLSQSSDACARKNCVERFRSELDVPPYSVNLRAAGDAAERACAHNQDDNAFAEFNACLARSAPCQQENCATALSDADRNGPHAAQISSILASARSRCAEDTAYADFNQCVARSDVCDRQKCGAALPTLAWGGSHAQEFATALETARNACGDENAFREFNQCVAQTDSCSRASCAAALPASVRNGPRAADINSALNAARDECDARRQAAPNPPETDNQPTSPQLAAQPSFNCAKASHPAEFAICADSDLAQLDVELAAAYSTKMSNLVGGARQALQNNEHRWLLYRNSTCDSPSTAIAKACLLPIFRARIAALRGY